MTKRAPFTKASLRRAIEVAEAAGKRVLAIKADGTILVDNGDGPHPLVPDAPLEAQGWEGIKG